MSDGGVHVVPHPELVFGLVGPLGVDIDAVTNALVGELRRVGYKSKVIKLSPVLDQIVGLRVGLKGKPEFARLDTHMDAGTELRTRTGVGGILAHIALLEIQNQRERWGGSNQEPVPHSAFILRQLKHRDEIDDLRDIYGDCFLSLSIYSPREARVRAAENRLTKTDPSRTEKIKNDAAKLIKKDEDAEGNTLGQGVTEAFPLGDFFVDGTDRLSIGRSIRRFIELFFGNHFVTPTRDEFGMYQANAAARRSADLSRQVGASLVTSEGEVIALGCNDIPKFGGGLYWSDDSPDGRDFARLGHDPSEKAKREMLAETLTRLHGARVLDSSIGLEDIGEQSTRLLKNELKGSQFAGLLEFGRVLHAEMAAILDAAKRGVSTKGATLYCTTFPCHLCARLIIAAGVERVVFVEPYPKSKTAEMYADSVSMDEAKDGTVVFQTFVGLSPRKYATLFELATKRKSSESGEANHWTAKRATPRVRRFQQTYLAIEQQVSVAVEVHLKNVGLSFANPPKPNRILKGREK